jgi:hypothetical protein
MRSGGRLKKGKTFIYLLFSSIQGSTLLLFTISGNPDCRLNGLSSGGCKIHGNPGFQEPSLLVRSYHREGMKKR